MNKKSIRNGIFCQRTRAGMWGTARCSLESERKLVSTWLCLIMGVASRKMGYLLQQYSLDNRRASVVPPLYMKFYSFQELCDKGRLWYTSLWHNLLTKRGSLGDLVMRHSNLTIESNKPAAPSSFLLNPALDNRVLLEVPCRPTVRGGVCVPSKTALL